MPPKPKSQFNLEDRFNQHAHNGVDSKKLNFTDLQITPESTISDPTGGMTVDTQARNSINAIIDVLQTFGFIE